MRTPVSSRELGDAREQGSAMRVRGTTMSSLSFFLVSLRTAWLIWRRAAHTSRCAASCATSTSSTCATAQARSPFAGCFVAVDFVNQHRAGARVNRVAGVAHGLERGPVEFDAARERAHER